MKTLYIDIYFLINFSVDVLAFYYAANMSHIKIGNLRLTLLGVIGGASAIIHILADSVLVTVANALISLLLFAFIGAGRVGLLRRLKFLLLFFIIQFLIGGCVTFGYEILDKYLYPLIVDIDDSVANRGALIFAVLVLFAIFIIRLLVLLFTSRSDEHSVGLSISLDGKKYECEAFVDSGNLVRDPISLTPVIFISAEGIRRMRLPVELSADSIDTLGGVYKSRIRLIPITVGGRSKVFVGFKLDSVCIKSRGSAESVDAIIVLNKEEKTYAGYDSLIPSCLVNDN